MGDFSKVVHWVLVAMAWLTEHPLQGYRFQDRFLEFIHFCHSFSFETVSVNAMGNPPFTRRQHNLEKPMWMPDPVNDNGNLFYRVTVLELARIRQILGQFNMAPMSHCLQITTNL